MSVKPLRNDEFPFMGLIYRIWSGRGGKWNCTIKGHMILYLKAESFDAAKSEAVTKIVKLIQMEII